MLPNLGISVSRTRRLWKEIALLTALAFLIIALTRPGWNPRPEKVKRMGRDVVFAIDVSRSMLAEDLAPNRLERAKLGVMDCVERLQGDRVGLVAFAGTAAVKCPLTLDYSFFRMAVDDLSPDSIARGGSMIGDAIRKCLDDIFDKREKRFKDVILITDGEDHESFPAEAAKEAGRRGIRIIAVGLGSESRGKKIPITDKAGAKKYIKYKGKYVRSTLDADTLRKMVKATPGGKYLNVSTGTIDLGQVYMDLVASAEKRELETRKVERYEEKFQIFLAIAYIILCAELVTGERKRLSS